MNLEKILNSIKIFINKYLKLLLYLFSIIVLIITFYFVYTDVYRTSISPDEIDESEIIAKKQKVNITLFKQIEDQIKLKNEGSVDNITNFFE